MLIKKSKQCNNGQWLVQRMMIMNKRSSLWAEVFCEYCFMLINSLNTECERQNALAPHMPFHRNGPSILLSLHYLTTLLCYNNNNKFTSYNITNTFFFSIFTSYRIFLILMIFFFTLKNDLFSLEFLFKKKNAGLWFFHRRRDAKNTIS